MPGGERPEEDCEGIGLRLREMVENGELTADEARERYNAICREHDGERPDDDCEAVGISLREMVENGELTREEAREQHSAACG